MVFWVQEVDLLVELLDRVGCFLRSCLSLNSVKVLSALIHSLQSGDFLVSCIDLIFQTLNLGQEILFLSFQTCDLLSELMSSFISSAEFFSPSLLLFFRNCSIWIRILWLIILNCAWHHEFLPPSAVWAKSWLSGALNRVLEVVSVRIVGLVQGLVHFKLHLH